MERQTNREHVVAIASDLFLRRGVATTSMDDVVRESGVAKSNIYYHFKSKEELLLAVVDHRIHIFEQVVSDAVARGGTSMMDRLRLFVEALTAELTGRDCVGGCPFISLAIQAVGVSDLVRQRIDRFFAAQHAQLETLITQAMLQGEVRNDIPPAEAAGLLMTAIEGSLVLAEVTRDSSLVQRRGSFLLNLLRPIS